MWFNGIMSFLLHSPFHSTISANTMLITWTGKKSGKKYSTPVNYLRQGEMLITTSLRRRTWWRGLHNSEEIFLLVQGKKVKVNAEVFATDESVLPALQSFLELAPGYARYFNIGMDEQNKPMIADLTREASKRVIVHFTPQGEAEN